MSLRTRLLILVIAAMLVPAILVGLRFVQNRSSEINAALANLTATADDIASDLDEKIQGTAQLHYGLARARDLDTRDKAACSAFLSEVREEYPQFTGILTIDPDGSLFCDLAADQPHPRPPGSRLFQAGPGVARHRARAGIRPADRTIGAPDRLSGAIGDGRPEADPARLLQPAQIRGVSRQAAARPEGDPAPRQQGNGSGRPLPRRMDRAGRHVDRGIRSAPLRCNAGPEGVSGGDRSRRPDAGLGCRRALAFDPRCRPLHHGRTVQGRTGRRGESPALRGCGDTRGGLAAAAGGRLDPCDRERRAPGRTSRHHGEETWARRSQRANSASPPGRRTGRIDDPAQRHRRSRSNSNAPPSPTSATSSANPRRWKPWASLPAAWRTISTIS